MSDDENVKWMEFAAKDGGVIRIGLPKEGYEIPAPKRHVLPEIDSETLLKMNRQLVEELGLAGAAKKLGVSEYMMRQLLRLKDDDPI